MNVYNNYAHWYKTIINSIMSMITPYVATNMFMVSLYEYKLVILWLSQKIYTEQYVDFLVKMWVALKRADCSSGWSGVLSTWTTCTWWQPSCSRWRRAWPTHQEATDERPSGFHGSWSSSAGCSAPVEMTRPRCARRCRSRSCSWCSSPCCVSGWTCFSTLYT